MRKAFVHRFSSMSKCVSIFTAWLRNVWQYDVSVLSIGEGADPVDVRLVYRLTVSVVALAFAPGELELEDPRAVACNCTNALLVRVSRDHT